MNPEVAKRVLRLEIWQGLGPTHELRMGIVIRGRTTGGIMLTVWIWASTMATLLPITVALFWLLNRFAGELFRSSDSTPADSTTEGTGVAEDDSAVEELQFSELSAEQIDDILEYYEKRNGEFASR
ncbi:MAG: hypothetical protein O2931_07915 [Planctomycetota bacterium]|nr:hypothetical protein [Planctomycetota bacterium]MDA1178707.1 hypothetical protein [Planctomycetota bacterium]